MIGQAGIFHTLLILLLAKSITTLTSLSISTISTNTPVAGGGAYFLISRSLGPEYGGAIGLTLFLAQAISVPFYLTANFRSGPLFDGTAIFYQFFSFHCRIIDGKYIEKLNLRLMPGHGNPRFQPFLARNRNYDSRNSALL